MSRGGISTGLRPYQVGMCWMGLPILTEPCRAPLLAGVRGACGHVELKVENPAELCSRRPRSKAGSE